MNAAMNHSHLQDDQQPMAEINMVPMIDIMLVLLIIFMVTAPLLTHAVNLELPNTTSAVNTPPPQTITIAIDAQGQYFCDEQPLTREALSARLEAAATLSPPPPLQLYADTSVPYGDVAALLAESSRLGLTNISFVSAPRALPGGER